VDPATGARVEPTVANGVKLERFVFDALPMCRASIVYETDRVEEFAPDQERERRGQPGIVHKAPDGACGTLAEERGC
jgi:UDP-N-acetylglucosamine/UDP-N-acetylgalactosamine diphosphorylase